MVSAFDQMAESSEQPESERKQAEENIGQNLSEGELGLVKSVIQDFLQALKIFQLYESGHPAPLKFLGRLRQDFDNYFGKNEALIIRLDELHSFFEGVTVYESKDLRESLSFMFFKDGIREIRFFKGLDQNEMLDFLTMIRKSNVVNRMEDDLVTLLWEKDFLHIDFTVIDQFLRRSRMAVAVTASKIFPQPSSIRTHRSQRCTDSASAAGSRLVSSHLCPPGSSELASNKASKGVSCLVSCPDEFPQRVTSFAHATA